MPKSKKTARYCAFIVYAEHFTPNGLVDSLESYGMPYVVSPLHSPEGRKSHYHVIVDNTETAFPSLYMRSIAVALHCPNDSWQDVQNIVSAEKYLRHETADSAHKQQFTKEQVCIFGLGYEMHKNTYVGEREITTMLCAYITETLSNMCMTGECSSLPELFDAVKKPEFYSNFDEPITFKIARCKGINELKTHFRFYLSLCEEAQKTIEYKENALNLAEQNEINASLSKFCLDVLQNDIDDKTARVILQNIYYNNKKFRDDIKVCGGLSYPRKTLTDMICSKSCDSSFLTCFSNYVDKYVNGISF